MSPTIHDEQKQSGFGIGLSMAQDLVYTFGGKISVHWEDGVMTFVVTLKRNTLKKLSTSENND